MNEMLLSGYPVCGSPEHLDVHSNEPPSDEHTASGQLTNADWEPFLVQLSAWVQQPGHRDEDGALSPTMQAISAGKQVIRWMREKEFPTPTNVVEDADGGIALTRRGAGIQEKVRISHSGGAEYLLFENSQLKIRQKLDFIS